MSKYLKLVGDDVRFLRLDRIDEFVYPSPRRGQGYIELWSGDTSWDVAADVFIQAVASSSFEELKEVADEIFKYYSVYELARKYENGEKEPEILKEIAYSLYAEQFQEREGCKFQPLLKLYSEDDKTVIWDVCHAGKPNVNIGHLKLESDGVHYTLRAEFVWPTYGVTWTDKPL